MKPTLFLITYITLITITASCTKCANCTQTTTTSVNVSTPGYPLVSKTTFSACGDYLQSVNGKTNTTTSNSGGIKATVVSRTTCQ